MVRQRLAVLGAALLAACGAEREPAPPAPVPVAALAPAPQAAPAPGITELPAYDPAAGHLDRQPAVAPPPRPRGRVARPIGLLLRSSPSGAVVAVDGLAVGRTPAYWEGEATGGERELTFTLPGHAVARYRFVPITSGVVHGRLEPLAGVPGRPGAMGAAAPGAPAASVAVPGPAASGAASTAPAPTSIAPVDPAPSPPAAPPPAGAPSSPAGAPSSPAGAPSSPAGAPSSPAGLSESADAAPLPSP